MNIYLRDTRSEELSFFVTLESEESVNRFILAYSLERHQQEWAKPEIVYKTILQVDTHQALGFVILALDPDRISVELRRIVIGPQGRGYGQITLRLLEHVCQSELQRNRIWLDVYDFNQRGQYLYEKMGYVFLKELPHQGNRLKVYEKHLSRNQ